MCLRKDSLKLNIECENLIVEKLHLMLGNAVRKDDINVEMANLQKFDKLKMKHLSAFYRCRVQEDLM